MTPYERALTLLGARSYSEKGLLRKLTQHGASAEEAGAVVRRLHEAGVLDDSKYALAYARSKLLGAGTSVRRVKQDLARKGVAPDVAAEAIAQVVTDEEVDTRAVIDRVARRKLAAMGDLEPVVLRRRLFAFLTRRGYDVDEIQSVVRRLFAEA